MTTHENALQGAARSVYLGLSAILVATLLGAGCGGDRSTSPSEGDRRLLGLWVPAHPNAARGLAEHSFILFAEDGHLEQFTGKEGVAGTYRVEGGDLALAMGGDLGVARFAWSLEGGALTLSRSEGQRPWTGVFKRRAELGSLDDAKAELTPLLRRFVEELEKRARVEAERHSPGVAAAVRSGVDTDFGHALSTSEIELSAMEHDGTRHPLHLRCTFVRRARRWALARARRATTTNRATAWHDLLPSDDEGRLQARTESDALAMLVLDAWQAAQRSR